MIYHLTSRRDWNEAQKSGEYRAESLESEGFIHCSTETQVLPVEIYRHLDVEIWARSWM